MGTTVLFKKILCVLPCLPEDLNVNALKALNALFSQTYPIDTFIIISKKFESNTVMERVAQATNNALSHIRLEDFDYILKANIDVILPTNFIEMNLRNNPDFCGISEQLIKVKPFIELCNGKVFSQSDDTYQRLLFKLHGLKVTKSQTPLIRRRSGAKHGLNYFVLRGINIYQLGYEPLHFFADMIFDVKEDVRNIVCLFGYALACLRQQKKFDIASDVWNHQIRGLEKLWNRSLFG